MLSMRVTIQRARPHLLPTLIDAEATLQLGRLQAPGQARPRSRLFMPWLEIMMTMPTQISRTAAPVALLPPRGMVTTDIMPDHQLSITERTLHIRA